MGWEFAILDFMQTLRFPAMDQFMIFISWIGEGGAVWIAIGLLLMISPKYRKYSIIIWSALLCGLLIGNLGLKNLIARPRPFMLRPDFALQIPMPGGFSFPSGHTLSSFEGAGVLYLMNRRVGRFALILAGLIGISRMYLYVHFPTDVLAGMILGLAIAYIVVWSYKKSCFMEKNVL